MLLNIPCYHGERLPEYGGGIVAHWNGKGTVAHLAFLKFIDGEPWGAYSCVECGQIVTHLKDLVPFLGGISQLKSVSSHGMT